MAICDIFTFFVVFIIWLGLANSTRNNCEDCIVYKTCNAAVVAIERRDPVVDDQLRSAFCGFSGGGQPMVCCSDLTAATQKFPDSVEDHPNLRFLPEFCGFSIWEYADKITIGGNFIDSQKTRVKASRGHVAGLYQFPWMVLISYKTRLGPQFKCSGSLINERYVLTAAHCISSQHQLLGVRIGEYDVSSATNCEPGNPVICESNIQDVRIEEVIPHPEYRGKPAIRNDIGLLRLKKRVNLDLKNVGTICLPVSDESQNRNISGLFANIAGWGSTTDGYISSKLITTAVPVHTAEHCRELYNRGKKPGDEDETINKICAGLDGKDSCRGDSGGPLMVSGPAGCVIQHGIVSYGPVLCGSKFPGIYTDVTKYVEWILDSMKP